MSNDNIFERKDNVLELKSNFRNKKTKYVLIMLHGLGSDNTKFAEFAKQLKINNSVRYVIPNAPNIPITINNNQTSRAWYDIMDITTPRLIDYDGILKSMQYIDTLIKKIIVVTGIKSQYIFIGGFSQGALMSYMYLLTTINTLAGGLIISGYLPNTLSMVKLSTHNKKSPILACHGKLDNVIPYDLGKQSYAKVREYGYNVFWRSYINVMHSISTKEIEDISTWLNNVLL